MPNLCAMKNQLNPPSRFGTESAASPVLLLSRRVWLCVAFGLLSALAFGVPPTRAAVTEAWVQRYNGPGNGLDGANAVAVDGSGNVVVTGFSNSSERESDYYTAKYAAADGALLWEQGYNGAGGGDVHYDVADVI